MYKTSMIFVILSLSYQNTWFNIVIFFKLFTCAHFMEVTSLSQYHPLTTEEAIEFVKNIPGFLVRKPIWNAEKSVMVT